MSSEDITILPDDTSNATLADDHHPLPIAMADVQESSTVTGLLLDLGVVLVPSLHLAICILAHCSCASNCPLEHVRDVHPLTLGAVAKKHNQSAEDLTSDLFAFLETQDLQPGFPLLRPVNSFMDPIPNVRQLLVCLVLSFTSLSNQLITIKIDVETGGYYCMSCGYTCLSANAFRCHKACTLRKAKSCHVQRLSLWKQKGKRRYVAVEPQRDDGNMEPTTGTGSHILDGYMKELEKSKERGLAHGHPFWEEVIGLVYVF